MQLNDIKQIKGRIILQSGLHIGAGDMEMHIGGTDNPVVKHPHTLEPYIPGSSLKGKVRSLLEMRSGLIGLFGNNGTALSAKVLDRQELSPTQREQAEAILKLFGSSGADGEAAAKLGPTRLSFADCNLAECSRDELRGQNLPFTEVKSENTINRINGTAEHPRFTERVPSGLTFDFAISLKVYGQDSGLEKFLLDGLKMLEYDALGGSGSRGYGRVRFEFDDAALQQQFNDVTLFAGKNN